MSQNKSRLDDLEVASPCSVSWASMSGDERVRACSQCRMRVYNLSAMTRDEAERLIEEKEGRLCVRFYQRADGTIITRDCWVGLRAARLKLLRLTGAIFAMAGVLSGCFGQKRKAPVMGRVAAQQADPGAVIGDVDVRHTMGEAVRPVMGAPAPMPQPDQR